MNKEDKIRLFSNELGDIQDERIRQFATIMIANADDYFFVVPASSSGKYHPSFDLGDQGLVRHTRCVVYYSECLSESFNYNSRTRDLLILSALAHDIKKQGDGAGKHTVTEHPLLAADYLDKIDKVVPDAMTSTELEMVKSAVKRHMGKWGGESGLPVPETEFEKCLQAADYIASRKEILSFNFRPTEEVVAEKKEPAPAVNESAVDPAKYVLGFGKHKGKTLAEIEPTGYLDWMVKQEEFFNKEAQSMARIYLEQLKNPVKAAPAIPEPAVDDLPF